MKSFTDGPKENVSRVGRTCVIFVTGIFSCLLLVDNIINDSVSERISLYHSVGIQLIFCLKQPSFLTI